MTKLSDEAEVLYRQIHPEYFTDGEPSSDRFKPYPRDNGMMSLDRSSLTSAQDSHALYVEQGRLSAAVFGLSVMEFKSESIECVASPIAQTPTTPANPAHASADFTPHAAKNHKNIAKRLKRHAVARGCLFTK
ncbi:hypothetical protein [Phytopseudomonas punonensis]|uniref:Uncharacterized protein n=1 Tax=Phytopseudomonas punonensis TaxID=1220495 RepID=A0A1M7NRU2_9GAMM|nr:hypothetical protein [Pseudomonas punonensis]SHN06344.1 hypothetical protein SAMN05216288_0433 [Pseudomonas punonensis]